MTFSFIIDRAFEFVTDRLKLRVCVIVSLILVSCALVSCAGVEGSRSYLGSAQNTEPVSFFAIEEDGKWGFINVRGKIVIEPVWDAALDFSEGLAMVKRDGLWGYITASGEIAIEIRYEESQKFSEGFAEVKINDLYGYMDKTGAVVI